MKDKPKVLTILSGVITILLGIALIIGIGILLLSSSASIGQEEALVFWILLAGLPFILYFVVFFVVLVIGALIITMGALEIKLGTRPNNAYVERKGSVITFCVLDAIVMIFAIISLLTATGTPTLVFGIGLLSALAICFSFKIIDRAVFDKRVKKGKIVIDNTTKKVDFSKIDLSSIGVKKDQAKELEKLKDLQEKNLISEEEYQKLRQKVLDNITK